MISKLLYALEAAGSFVKRHPQLQFAFLLIILLPLVFLYSSNQFLEAGRANQDKLQRDRIGLLHDSFASLLSATNFDPAVAQNKVTEIAELNPDLTKFRVIWQDRNEFIPVAALDVEVLGVPEEEPALYQAAAARFDESLIFPFLQNDVRFWQSVRVVQDQTGQNFYILTENSFAQVDAYLLGQERSAYVSLVLVYLILLAVAFWLVRLTNYKNLYTEAEQAIKTKDLFSNMIAHELRAPLTAIKGYATMQQDDQDLLKNKGHAEKIAASSDRLLTIVNDLLDIARIQSGKLSFEIEHYDVNETAKAVQSELLVSAERKGIAINLETGDTEAVALVDPKRLHQAVTNLVSNAIKYTKEGEISISVEEKTKVIELRVKDTGMGISAEDQQKLFAPFYRVTSTDVSKITGTGLGMWITRQLIELMDGSIGIESIKGVGTHVVVLLKKR